MLWLYSALCSCFSKLAWQALASTPGAACDLLGEAAAPQAGSRQHKATHKLTHMFMTKMFWRSWESTFVLSPSSLLVSCELFVSMRVIHQKQLKLSELYATVYHSLCRCLIPPLYTMFMPTTLCHNCLFCWMLQVVTLCCLMLLHPYARNVSRFTLYQLYVSIYF